MKKILTITLLLATTFLFSCGGSKQIAVKNRFNGKVKSVKVSGYISEEMPHKLKKANISDLLPALDYLKGFENKPNSFGNVSDNVTIRDYDQTGHIVSIKDYDKDMLIQNEKTFVWKDGLMLNRENRHYNHLMHETDVSNLTFVYDGRNIMEENGSFRDLYRKVYSRDKNGVVTGWVGYDKKGDIVEMCSNTIKNGKIVKSESVNGYYNKNMNQHITEYVYRKGAVVEEVHSVIKGAENMKTFQNYTCTFKDGLLIDVTYNDSVNESNIIKQFDYEKFKEAFDREMALLKLDDEADDTPSWWTGKYTLKHDASHYCLKYSYNENRDLVSIEDGEIIYTFKYDYDDQHNWIKRTVYRFDEPLFVTERVIIYY